MSRDQSRRRRDHYRPTRPPGGARGPQPPQGRSKPMPRPAGVMCSPLCPYFRCSKKALFVTTQHYRGQPLRVPYCQWIGDKCIGAQCQYAYCAIQKMLPDGRCAWALEKRQRKARDFEEDLERSGPDERTKNLLTKLGFKGEEF